MHTSFNTPDLRKAKSFISQIKTRTWVIFGAVVVGILGLIVWIAISLMTFLWGQASAGMGLANTVLSSAEQQFPALRERAEQLAPALTAEARALKEQAQRFAPELAKTAEQMLPKLPLSNATPLTDVSGEDIGSVARFPGLIRSAFSRDGETIQVDYQGEAALDAVVAHYTKGFVAAGFVHEVVRATPHSELHKFTQHASAITMLVDRLKSHSLSVQLTSNPKRS